MDKPSNVPLQGQCQAREHVTECRYHGVLIVGETRHHRSQVPPGLGGYGLKKPCQTIDKVSDLIPQVKAHVQGNLIVSAPARMHFSNSFDTETLDEFAFYVGVHILSRYIEFEKSPVVVVLQFS